MHWGDALAQMKSENVASLCAPALMLEHASARRATAAAGEIQQDVHSLTAARVGALHPAGCGRRWHAHVCRVQQGTPSPAPPPSLLVHAPLQGLRYFSSLIILQNQERRG